MEFEKTLRERLYRQEIENVERQFQNRYMSSLNRNNYQEIRSIVQDAYSIYMESKLKGLSKEKLYRLFEEFNKATTEEALDRMKEHVVLEDREREYIQYNELKMYWERRKSC